VKKLQWKKGRNQLKNWVDEALEEFSGISSCRVGRPERPKVFIVRFWLKSMSSVVRSVILG
jgi:hypothetical protein